MSNKVTIKRVEKADKKPPEEKKSTFAGIPKDATILVPAIMAILFSIFYYFTAM
jgi:hypothetical protein